MAALYTLTQYYINLLELIDNPELEPDIIKASLDGIQEEIDIKAENIAKLIKSIEVDVAGFREEEIRLANRRKTLENRKEGLKTYLDEAMRATGIEKIKGKIFTIAFQKNPPSVDILDAQLLPKEYFCEPVEPAPDKKHIMEDLKAGKEIPGAAIKQGMSLRIR